MRLTKKDIKKLQKDLGYKTKHAYDVLKVKEKTAVKKFGNDYKKFLDAAKTEREAVEFIKEAAEKHGFKDAAKYTHDKMYKVNKNKTIALTVLGHNNPVTYGINIIGSHIDSPRLDLKQKPLFESHDLTYLKSHYYGGIKKYQWLNIPLAIHGVLFRKDGTKVEITVGEKDTDPVFVIADLLPHLSMDQYDSTVRKAFPAEKLNVLVGSLPVGDDKTANRFKLAVLHHLNSEYKIVEEDFIGADIELVPAQKARDVGFDRGLIGAYGHDDRICAYTSLRAILELETPPTTAMALFVDKEEIGSDGNTGVKSHFMGDFISDILWARSKATERELRRCLLNSRALSADVTAGLNPDYADQHEANNAAILNHGICIGKSGGAGKYYSNDTNAEFLSQIRMALNKDKVIWQTGSLGKLEKGGGGTIAVDLAVYGMEVLDCGPALLSMHSPMEIASKADTYMTYKAFKTFYKMAQ